MKKTTIILPIQEPWATMIRNGEKTLEFRKYVAKIDMKNIENGDVEIWVVATGTAPKPRKIVAKAKLVDFLDYNKLQEFKKRTNINLGEWGYQNETNVFGWKLEVIEKTDILLSDLGIFKTPQKYQFLK